MCLTINFIFFTILLEAQWFIKREEFGFLVYCLGKEALGVMYVFKWWQISLTQAML